MKSPAREALIAIFGIAAAGVLAMPPYVTPHAGRPATERATAPGPWSVSNITEELVECTDLKFGDMNGDGYPDIVSGHADLVGGFTGPKGKPVRVTLNNGTENPWEGASGVQVSENILAGAVELADVNGDHKLDIIVAAGTPFSTGGAINRVYINDGSGVNFTGYDITSDKMITSCIAAGDVDGDGDTDIVAGNTGRPTLFVPYQPARLYLNNGTGTGWTGSNITGDQYSTYGIEIHDIDQDGDNDVLCGNGDLLISDTSAGSLRRQVNRIYYNDGGGTPWVPAWSARNMTDDRLLTADITIGEFDNDSRPDVFTVTYGRETATDRNHIYFNQIQGKIWESLALPQVQRYETCCVSADMDNDGRRDVVVGADGRTYLLRNMGQGLQWASTTLAPVSYFVFGVDVADADGDADLDVADGVYDIQPNRFYQNTGREIDVTPLMDFANRSVGIGQGPAQYASIYNLGGGGLRLGDPAIELTGAGADQFDLADLPITTPMAPNSSRQIGVTFEPSSLGLKTATIIVRSNDANEPQTAIQLRGTGAAFADSDGDGFSDQIELDFSTGAWDANSKPPFGDFSGDGVTDLADAIALYRAALPLTPYDDALDVNQDGAVDMGDADMLLNWVLGHPGYDFIPPPPAP